jgi:hypothetical protein
LVGSRWSNQYDFKINSNVYSNILYILTLTKILFFACGAQEQISDKLFGTSLAGLINIIISGGEI